MLEFWAGNCRPVVVGNLIVPLLPAILGRELLFVGGRKRSEALLAAWRESQER